MTGRRLRILHTTPLLRCLRIGAFAGVCVAILAVPVPLVVGSLLPVTPTPGAVIMGEEEELTYEVSWTFVKLGLVRVRTNKDFTAEARIDSYSGLPYVDLHSIYYTRMDSMLLSVGARSFDKREDGEWTGTNYITDSARQSVAVEETRHKDPASPPVSRFMRDTIFLPRMTFVDGLSIAYFPRKLVHTSQPVQVPTILLGKLGDTSFYLPGEQTTVDISAVDYPIRAIELEGTTTVVGLFGMTGDFRGWFSDDDSAVPLKGKLKVLLGSVTVELIQWKRRAWAPPR